MGYAIVRDSGGRAVKSIDGVTLGAVLNLQLQDGMAETEVLRKNNHAK
jgi:exonuclease VII large subunit